MPNIIMNGDFERTLEMWDVRPEDYAQGDQPFVSTVERQGEFEDDARGLSLKISLARFLSIEQTLQAGAHATERYLRFSCCGYAADFYVNVHYADGTSREAGHYYGHWRYYWRDETVRVSTTKPIARIEFLFTSAMDFYLDDISLEGTLVAPPLPWFKKAPEEVDGAREIGMRLEEHFLATEHELNRIRALLSMQTYPNLRKEVDDALAKRLPNDTLRRKK
jgi:hypothetical protein